jgi:hypothetical protein
LPDETYNTAPSIPNSLPSDPRTIEVVESAGIALEEYLQFVKSLKKEELISTWTPLSPYDPLHSFTYPLASG